MFLRPRLVVPREYCEYLYFLVPILAALVHLATLTGIAAKQGYCSAFEPYQPGTASFVLFVVCAYMLTPALCLLYNVITFTRIILSLLQKQREINKCLQKISAENQVFLSSSKASRCKTTMRHEEQRLRAARNVYNAAVRIAMYTIAPLAWFCCNIAYYYTQYFIQLTDRSEIPKFVHMQKLAWFGHAATVLANFLVFVTDPSVVRVIKEVNRELTKKHPLVARHKEARVEPNQEIDTVSSSDSGLQVLSLDTMSTKKSAYQLAFPGPSDDESAVNLDSMVLEAMLRPLHQRCPANQSEADAYIRRM
ncbi:hypothetical protein EC988_007675 [Linderina pennispora]|nr:hypothetical protein EC988_007675 [Linderina pennispora]